MPPEFDCLGTAIRCYANYRQSVPVIASLSDRIATVAGQSGTLVIDRKNLPPLSNIQIAEHGVFIRKGKGEQWELLLTRFALDRCFADWKSFRNTDEGKAMLRREEGRPGKVHWDIKRRIRSNEQHDRFYCFLLPANWRPTENMNVDPVNT